MPKLSELPRGQAGVVEDRRRQTEDALVAAGRELFASQGYTATSVADIAAKAGVGLRTFYRYFPAKEWIACDGVYRFSIDGLAAVHRRPADETPLESMLHAITELENGGYEATLTLDIRLVLSEPSVWGAHFQIVMSAQDELTELFAARLGVPPASMAARLPAAVATLAFQSAISVWWDHHEAGEPSPTVWALAREALEALRPALAAR